MGCLWASLDQWREHVGRGVGCCTSVLPQSDINVLKVIADLYASFFFFFLLIMTAFTVPKKKKKCLQRFLTASGYRSELYKAR